MSETRKFSMDTVVAAVSEQVSTEISGEAVILHLVSGTYFGLNEVGSWIWQSIQAPTLVREVRDAILAEYNVEPERCDQDLFALLDSLAAQDLVRVVDQA